MRYSEFKRLVKTDLYRYDGVVNTRVWIRHFLFTPGFRYTVLMRLCSYTKQLSAFRYTLYPFFRFMHAHYSIKYLISIPYNTSIDTGFYIGHYGGIVVNTDARIGKNCNVSHNVTIGQTNRGKYKGSPIIGDNVYVAPGAKIIGGITIGNNVAIGANCVVTKDIPDKAVVVGIPGEVISYNGSNGYINRTDY